MSKQLAIMSAPHFGMRDMNQPAFWFDVRFGEDLSSGALIVLSMDTMAKLVEEADVHDIALLKNHPCQVEVAAGKVEFVRIVKQ